MSVPSTRRLIEDHSFPFEELSRVAERESWRKEVYRPVYHIHKWWAQRLGSVFRAILIGTFAPDDSDLMDLFYRPVRVPDATIFDPFAGSGTTLGEALKMGMRAVGCDINPVACLAARSSLSGYSRSKVLSIYNDLEARISPAIRRLYQTTASGGRPAETLYYFWVKVVPCPECGNNVDLFSSRIFARHIYPQRHPESQAVCPACGEVNQVRYDATFAICSGCGEGFEPQTGPVSRARMTCPTCRHSSPILAAVRKAGGPPGHRLYAKLVLLDDGTKEYLRADRADLESYQQASLALQDTIDPYPVVAIQPGHNTDQVLNYGYRFFHQMFNDRQLLGLALLADGIRKIESAHYRRLFTCLFSGVLEFNNLFASYKGEGTGAVRHMFAHHILKPERTPIEANLWGTQASSGSFSNLFKSRILRLLDYQDRPFEVDATESSPNRVWGLSVSLNGEVVDQYSELSENRRACVRCTDSAKSGLPDESIDAVVTDPPFFDNVHYSELADFFYIWQRHLLGGDGPMTTRSPREVQCKDPDEFAERLGSVWMECHRVLKNDGLLVFTYHHSRPEGWVALLASLIKGGFRIVSAHPVKSEMSAAIPKRQARQPINLDVILVCRKAPTESAGLPLERLMEDAANVATTQVQRYCQGGRTLGLGDCRVILMAQLIARLSQTPDLETSLEWLNSHLGELDAHVDALGEASRPA